MKKFRIKKIVSLASISVISLLLSANINAIEAEDATEFRQSIFQIVKWNFGKLVGVAKGEVEYNAESAKLAAHYLAIAAEMAKEGFIPGTYGNGKSNAKKDIDEKAEEFEQKYQSFLQAAQEMLVASNDEATLKAQVGKIGATCKACHDNFKKD